uniref:Band 7 domain-containing protein n=1 Tax=Aplanochytrium stocchinoi TaxID=215587 RepID=A0A7S3LK89_9STRA|mmetsp:Transcript_31718/g.39111  ORF Transcript_31718/g.39111 Transcript_31718/m.39111 type:complete len:289 (+) Transcript_31718:115-981(+)|eukprot:CAMPEP_0204826456 /NCGR_PEP_ID=MMETSP1346-20131115/4142_1 /ASSEMBLY_ACC=CAM_ASM_000771 /TAXON_ID=215587 /ORGANISM="Aplanochytrium stocchinoi, Strain GSBS06" /LENGTH=288 /DNA_ID=CAMNT_0051954493 /DNA_START=44 /DNA_END=910 /DNA_ORIENTATION=+
MADSTGTETELKAPVAAAMTANRLDDEFGTVTPRAEIPSDQLKEIYTGTSPIANVLGVACFPFTAIGSCYTIEPRTEAIITNFGVLTEVVSEPGCHWHNCWGREMLKMSTAELIADLGNQKIIDARGNPIIVSAVISYRVTDVKKALLNVNQVGNYVTLKAQAILKQVVGQYSYDDLKLESDSVSAQLKMTLKPELDIAGVLVSSMRLNELNYAPEIAGSMLKKQQAAALIEARHLIVEGAVEIAQTAVSNLEKAGLTMNDQERIGIVSNILTVTCSDNDAQPTISLR